MLSLRPLPLLLLVAVGACSSVTGGKDLPMPRGGFSPLNTHRTAGENGLVESPTPGRTPRG